jgi:tetratricopeptide (TPR) repeat protein
MSVSESAVPNQPPKQNQSSASPPTSAKNAALTWLVSTAGTVLVLAAVGAYLTFENQMVHDAEFTPLYQFTLSQAYSRFKASEQRVALNAATDPLEAMTNPQAAGVPGRSAQPQAAQRQVQSAQAQPMAQDDGGPYTARGNEFLQAGKYAEAITAFQMALKENPQRVLTLHGLGDAYRYAQQYDEAIATYRQVLKLSPNYHCCHTHIGDIERARNNAEAASQAYAAAERGYAQQLEQGGPGAAGAKFHLARLYVEQNKNLAQALVFAQDIVEAQPDQVAYQQTLAQVYERMGRMGEAVAIYESLAASSPQYADFFRQQIERLQQADGIEGPVPPAQ